MIAPKKESPFGIGGEKIDFEVVIDDYVEFSGREKKEIITKIENCIQNLAAIWKETVKTGSNEEVKTFYSESDYIYEILHAYFFADRFRKRETYTRILEYVKSISGKEIMDFGGGTGQLCLMLYFNTEKKVTYVDLPSRVMEFAKWRFGKYKADIKCLEVEVNNPDVGCNIYDCIISDSVLEHVLNLEGTIKSLSKSLKPEGTFYLLFDSVYNEDYPMHISAKKNVEKIMETNGLVKISDFIYIKSDRLSVHMKHFSFVLGRNIRRFVRVVKHPKKILNRVKTLL